MSRLSQQDIYFRLRRRDMTRRILIIGSIVGLLATAGFLIKSALDKRQRPPGRALPAETAAASTTPSAKTNAAQAAGTEDEPTSPTVVSADPSSAPSKTGLTQQQLDGKKAEIEETLRNYVQAGNDVERAKYVRLPWVVRPYMEEYYSRPEQMKLSVGKVERLTLIEDRGLSLVQADMSFATELPRSLIFEWDGSRFLIDWESLVNYSVMSWEDFQKNRPNTAVAFRVLASRGEFYFPPFSQTTWTCVTLRHESSEAPLYAYFKNNEVESQNIRAMLPDWSAASAKVEETPLMVEISYPDPPGRANQVLLNRVVGRGWIRQIR